MLASTYPCLCITMTFAKSYEILDINEGNLSNKSWQMVKWHRQHIHTTSDRSPRFHMRRWERDFCFFFSVSFLVVYLLSALELRYKVSAGTIKITIKHQQLRGRISLVTCGEIIITLLSHTHANIQKKKKLLPRIFQCHGNNFVFVLLGDLRKKGHYAIERDIPKKK